METSKPKSQSLVAVGRAIDLNGERFSALERVVELWEQGTDVNSEELMKALDVLAVAHIAASLDWASGSFS